MTDSVCRMSEKVTQRRDNNHKGKMETEKDYFVFMRTLRASARVGRAGMGSGQQVGSPALVPWGNVVMAQRTVVSEYLRLTGCTNTTTHYIICDGDNTNYVDYIKKYLCIL